MNLKSITKTIKKYLGKLWYFIWEDESIWSWIVNLVLAFILIKFLVYPGLGLIFSTSHPVVAVVSGSMEHDDSFDDWWESLAYCDGTKCTQEQWYALNSIDKTYFQDFSFKNGFNKGDIMVLKGEEAKNINIGDVIVFQTISRSDPIIHRVVDIKQDGENYVFQTKGDHNYDSGNIDMDISEDNLIGKAVFRIPILGWIKIGFVELLKLLHIV